MELVGVIIITFELVGVYYFYYFGVIIIISLETVGVIIIIITLELLGVIIIITLELVGVDDYYYFGESWRYCYYYFEAKISRDLVVFIALANSFISKICISKFPFTI